MTFRRVIIPVDVSNVSAAAIECAADLATRLAVEVVLTSVSSARDAGVVRDSLTELAAADLPGAEVRVIASDDDVEAVLVSEFLATPESLWCVASRGRTAVGELLFGSISADLVRDAQAPIMIIGPHARSRPQASVLAVALDGSDVGEAILPTAADLAGQLGLSLRLLQVGHGEMPSDADETSYVHRVATQLAHPADIDFDVLHGDAADQLADYLSVNADVAVLAMSTRGIPAGARVSVPSVAMRVVRHAQTPVLMLHPSVGDAPHVVTKGKGHRDSRSDATDERAIDIDARPRVVVGIDTLAASEPALRWAAEEAHRRGVLLQVIHTWQVPVGTIYGAAVWPEMEACRDAAVEAISDVRESIGRWHPDLAVETVVAEGNAGHVIASRSVGATLVVLGRHHHHWVTRAVFGSTPASVLAKVECPLVIVPCDADEASSIDA